MCRRKLLLATIMGLFSVAAFSNAFAQGTANDIPESQLPGEVRQVLVQYLNCLQKSDLSTCADCFLAVAGGSLVNDDGRSLRANTERFGLKKDFDNIKFYQVKPLKITRINKGNPRSSGYGPSAIRGPVYKIWLDKKPGQAGMPAPVSIIVPEGHPSIKTPKVVNIGSL